MVGRALPNLNPLALRHRGPLLLVGAVVGFVCVIAATLNPPDPESRLPGNQRMAALIERQQSANDRQRLEVDDLRQTNAAVRDSKLNSTEALATQKRHLTDATQIAGATALRGNGFVVTLDDSSESPPAGGNVNDYVIHSQDVQAVVNALWGAGAEAISISGQRVVGTSAILCVGSTLLLNGTVHAPPYEISAIGADKRLFNDDPLVKRLHNDTERYKLRFSTGKDANLTVPAYSGALTPKYAKQS